MKYSEYGTQGFITTFILAKDCGIHNSDHTGNLSRLYVFWMFKNHFLSSMTQQSSSFFFFFQFLLSENEYENIPISMTDIVQLLVVGGGRVILSVASVLML